MRTRYYIMPRQVLAGLLLVLLVPGSAYAQQGGMPLPVEIEPVTSMFTHKLSVRGGYGPEETRLGADGDDFISIRYEPAFHWFSPDHQWPRWEAIARAWLNYDSQRS